MSSYTCIPFNLKCPAITKPRSLTVLLVFVFGIFHLSNIYAQNSLYVDHTANGLSNGSSWANAYNDLTQALENINPGDIVKIAAGEYIPSAFPDSCSGCAVASDFSFYTRYGVKILGGYPNGGGDENSRDWLNNEVVLSGNIGDPMDSLDNAFHVFVSDHDDTTLILDGLTIRNGRADSSYYITLKGSRYYRNHGGGIHSNFGKVSVINCRIINNYASDGGAVRIAHSGITSRFDDCYFYNNTCNNDGGAIFTESDSTFVNNCIFEYNFSRDLGGAINARNSSLWVNNTRFYKNQSTTDYAGAICNHNGNLNVFKCSFEMNKAQKSGGAIWALYCKLDVDSSYFYGNRAQTSGGSIYSETGSNYVTIKNSVIDSNYASSVGGGIGFSTARATVSNCRITRNATFNYGAGIHVTSGTGQDDVLKIVNCLFAKNSARWAGHAINCATSHCTLHLLNSTVADHSGPNGGAAFVIYYNSPLIRNTIVWGNIGNFDFRYGANTSNFKYTISNITTGEGNFRKDPHFVDPANFDYTLQLHSPAIGSAYNDFMASTDSLDLYGNPRIVLDTIDRGPFEFQYHFPCGKYQNLTIDNDPVLGLHYKADQISSRGTINAESNAPVIYNAIQSINLLEDFTVEIGQIFEAKVEDPCID